MTTKAMNFLEELAGGPLRLGQLLMAIREGEGLSQVAFAEVLGVSRSHLCDIEKGRKVISPERAARFANALGYSETQFVRLALQEILDDAGLKMQVKLEAA